MRKINWVWRLFVTGIACGLFSIGGLLMTLAYFPLLNLILKDPMRRAAAVQTTIHAAFSLYLTFIKFIGVCSLEVENKHHLEGVKGTLIIANHPSLLDTVILMAQMDRAQCIVKHELWNNFFLGGVMRAANYVRNDQDPTKLIDDCVAVLERGDNLIIFPEGTRTKPGEILGKLQRGVANVVLSSGAPILPVILHCNHTTLAKGEPWYRIPPTKLAFKIKFSEPMNSDTLCVKEESHSLSTRRMTAAIRDLLKEQIVSA